MRFNEPRIIIHERDVWQDIVGIKQTTDGIGQYYFVSRLIGKE